MDKVRFKIFTSYSQEVERMANEWLLKKGSKVEIIDFKFQMAYAEGYAICILYKEKP